MHLVQILPRLVRSGFDVAVQTLSGPGALSDRLAMAGVTVISPPARPGRRILRALRAAFSLASTIRRFRPEIIHFFLPESYLVGAPLALALGVPYLVMSRRSLNGYQRRYPLIARVERALHRRMDALLGNSAAIVAQLIAEGADRACVHLIVNGVDLERFSATASRPADGQLRLVSVANLIPYKGHADLIDALAGASTLLGDWKLRCAGRDDGQKAALERRAQDAGIGKHVEFLGPRGDIPELLAESDIAVLASHEEGFPNAVIEAMAAGLPVVATRVGGVPEAVLDGVTGLLVPPHDPLALSDAIRRLADDPGLRTRMGVAGRARATELFSLDSCADNYATFYRNIKQ